VALGVAYFPNDGTNKPKTDELFFEHLENTSSFVSSGYEVILMGDLNGRCVTKCPFSDKNRFKWVFNKEIIKPTWSLFKSKIPSSSIAADFTWRDKLSESKM
jgi:hypothetical protein